MPPKTIQTTLARLLNDAEDHPGELQTVRLSNNLKIDCKICNDGETSTTHVQVSRSNETRPSDWSTIERYWPYPVQVKPRRFKHHGREYLQAAWPTQPRLSLTIESQPQEMLTHDHPKARS